MICQLFFFPSSQSEQFGQKCESFKRVDGDHLTLIMEVIVDAFSPLFNYCHSSCKLVDRGFVNDIIGLVLDNEPLVTLHRLATQMILTTAALSQTEECNRWFSRSTITLVFLLLFLILSNRWDTFRSAQKSYPSRFSGLGFGLAVSCGWFITLIKNWNILTGFAWIAMKLQHRFPEDTSCVVGPSTHYLNLSSAHLSKLDSFGSTCVFEGN